MSDITDFTLWYIGIEDVFRVTLTLVNYSAAGSK